MVSTGNGRRPETTRFVVGHDASAMKSPSAGRLFASAPGRLAPARAMAGYSLLELLVVLLIIGILSSATASIFFLFRPRAEFQLAQQEIEAVLQRARTRAVTKGNNQFVEFSLRQVGTSSFVWVWRHIDDDGWNSQGPLSARAVYDEDLSPYFDIERANNGVYDHSTNHAELYAEGRLGKGIRVLRSPGITDQAFRPRITFTPLGQALFEPTTEPNILLLADNVYVDNMDPGDSRYRDNQSHRVGLQIASSGAITVLRSRTR